MVEKRFDCSDFRRGRTALGCYKTQIHKWLAYMIIVVSDNFYKRILYEERK